MDSSTFEKVIEPTTSSESGNSEKAIELTNSSTLIPQNFRLQASQIFLTYKYHINPSHLIDNIINKKYEVDQWIICHEIADETNPYHHTHAAITFKKRVDIRNCRVFDTPAYNAKFKSGLFGWEPYPEEGEVVHPNMAKCENWGAAIQYIIKEGKKTGKRNWFANFVPEGVYPKAKSAKRPGNPKPAAKEIASLCDRIVSHTNAFDAIKHEATSLRDVMAINTIFKNKNDIIDEEWVKETTSIKLYPWQKKLLSITKEKANRRDIHWIYEKIGGTGKSTFCDYLECTQEGVLTISDSGSMRDIADVIRNWTTANGNPKHIILDLPRTLNDRTSIYTIIENIKNGRLTCTKYAGARLRFRTPHVFVFANWKPMLTHLSVDRWHIHKIVDSKFLVEVTRKKIIKDIGEEGLKECPLFKEYNFLDEGIDEIEKERQLVTLKDIIKPEIPVASIPIRTYTDVQKEVPAIIISEKVIPVITEKEMSPATILEKVIQPQYIPPTRSSKKETHKKVNIDEIAKNTVIPPHFIDFYKKYPTTEALILLSQLDKNTRTSHDKEKCLVLQFD